jgi:hypothetical protein
MLRMPLCPLHIINPTPPTGIPSPSRTL